MSATITDYFNKASNMSGSYPAVATVTAARSTGGSTLSCDDLSSWATDTPVHFSTFKVNTDGTIDTSTQTDWKGIVNGNTITDMTRLAGAADSGNASGDRVELNPTVGWLDDLITGILVSHKQNGALKDNAVTESSIATGAVTNTKLGDGSVTSAKIGTGAISSYDKIGDDVIQARNLDESSFGNKTSYFDIGGIRIAFGSGSLSVPNNQETQTPAISYGVTFASTPKIVVTVKGWIPLRLCVTNGANTSNFKVVLNQNYGSTLTVNFDWVAIGVKPA